MIAIVNAGVVLEDGILTNGVILVENDRIAAVGTADTVTVPQDVVVCDANGLFVGPGFVDIHVHGGDGCFLYVHPEKAANHFLKHGETTVLTALYYNLSKDEFLEAIARLKAVKESGKAQSVAGFYMEGPYMNPQYGAAPEQNKWRGEICKDDYLPIVQAAGDMAKVWAVAPERDGIEAFVRDAKNVYEDTIFSVGHSQATPREVRALKPYGLQLQTHSTNATGRRGEGGGVRRCGPDEACFLDDDMYAEVICDSRGIHIEPDMLRLIIKIKGVDKVVLISDSFVSDAPNPPQYSDIADLQFDNNGGLCGSKLTLDFACKNLLTHTDCTMIDAFLMASRNPAQVIGMENEIGTIAVGKKANLVIVDQQFDVKDVVFEGEFVKENA